MKLTLKNLAAFSALAVFAACGTATEEVETTSTETPATENAVVTEFTINTEKSVVQWKGSMLGAHSHNGLLKFNKGNFTVTDGQVTSGTFEVDMTSINPTDDGYSEENPREGLIGHLSSDDFFAVQKFPTASLVLMEGGKAKMTVRGVTKEVQVKEIKVANSNGNAKATATLVFDRTKFDVAFVHPLKEMVLSDDIELKIELAATAS